jgi:uncharacterized protein (DUF433 family)
MSKLVTEIVAGEAYEYYPLGKYVVRAKGVCGGKPTFKYTRIEVAGTLSRIKAGESVDSIVEGYEGRVPREAISEVIQVAASLGKKLNRGLPHKNGAKLSVAK